MWKQQPVGCGQKRSRRKINMSFKAFLLPLALAFALIPRGNAQSNNHTPGTVVAWGSQVIPYVASGTRFTKIAAGVFHSMALKSDGTVFAWGDNEYGESTVPSNLTGVVAIAAGFDYDLSLKSDGTVVAWGDNGSGESTVPANLTGVVAIAAGYYNSLALKSDGTVVAWGDNGSGESTVPSNLTGVVAIAAGYNHSMALKSDGTVVAWGDNGSGESTVPSNLTGVVAIAAGVNHSLALVAAPNPIGSISVTPSGTTFFGSIRTGGSAEQTFTVSDVGNADFLGSATVAPPFVVVAGSDYNLAPGESQSVTIRYAPTMPGNASGYVTFTIGTNIITRQIVGSAYNDPTLTTGSISGQVTRSDTGAGVNGAAVTVVGPGANVFNGGSSPNTLTGINGGQSGMYVISGLPPNFKYDVIVTPPLAQLQQLYMGESDGVVVIVGPPSTANVQLTPVPVNDQPPAPTPQNTPVVLVRGFGPDTDWNSGESDYWSTITGAIVGEGIQNVWNCNEPEQDVFDDWGHVINGELGIEANAANLAKYIQEKAEAYKVSTGFYPSQINIVAHSMGGLITRRLLGSADHLTFIDSTTQEPFTIRINKVVMLATPNCGSPVADAYYLYGLGVLGGLLNRNWDSTHDLTRYYSTLEFNQTYGNWPAAVPLYLFSATGGYKAFTDDSLFGALMTAGSDYITTVNTPLGLGELVNDGVVTQPSVNGVFSELSATWPPIQSYASVVLNPVQSISDGDFGESLDHLSLLNDSAVAQWVANTLENANATPTPFQRSAMSLAHNGATAMDLTNDPSLLPMQMFAQTNGLVSPGATNPTAVISDAATKLIFQMICDDTNAVLTLLDPSGMPINFASPESNTNVQYSVSPAISNVVVETFEIGDPENGSWTAIVGGAKVSSTNAAYSLTVLGDSGASLIPQTGSEFGQGQDAVITCTLADVSTNPATPVLNASITATVRFPDGLTNTLTLYDDGLHNDGATDDGVYAAVLTNVQEAGNYSVFYQCQATNDEGQALQRVATGTFSVSAGDASLVGDPVYETVDTNGDGVADFLVVQCWVNASIAGTYAVSCDLVDSTETNRFSESAKVTVSSSGTTTVPLIFNLAEFPTLTGSTNYHVENLQLFEITPTGLSWLDAYHGSSTVTISSVPSAPIITSNTNLPSAIVDVPYSTTLQAMGGTTPYTWSIVAGTLPTGLSLGSGGTIGGIPSEAETSVFTIQATANNGLSSTNTFSLEADPGFPPVASFLAGPTNGVAPLLVTFTNTSSGIISNQIWMFGNGNISSATNPIYTYTNAGVFTVSLTLVGPGGTNTVIQTNLITVTIPQTGSLEVTISPPGAISAGAQWQVDGGQSQNSGATVSNLSVGNHTMSFNTINGWTTPASQTVSVSVNSTATEIGTYAQQYGSLQVTISPASAITAGAKWQVDGGTSQNSEATVSNLSVGSHTVSFTTISGWITPSNQTVSLSANSTAKVSGTYVAIAQTGSLQVTISPVSAITAGAKWQVDGGTLQNSGTTVTNLSVGNHTVSFNTINGWTTPANQTVSVSANSTPQPAEPMWRRLALCK
jgi:PKD repeat protein/pimeloyl-ACP methyl ester carboxylesterase